MLNVKCQDMKTESEKPSKSYEAMMCTITDRLNLYGIRRTVRSLRNFGMRDKTNPSKIMVFEKDALYEVLEVHNLNGRFAYSVKAKGERKAIIVLASNFAEWENDPMVKAMMLMKDPSCLRQIAVMTSQRDFIKLSFNGVSCKISHLSMKIGGTLTVGSSKHCDVTSVVDAYGRKRECSSDTVAPVQVIVLRVNNNAWIVFDASFDGSTCVWF